ncbi:MAG: hypothetical protein GY856_08600 [bacterium]|nr:hypothetical protein [bacterium]
MLVRATFRTGRRPAIGTRPTRVVTAVIRIGRRRRQAQVHGHRLVPEELPGDPLDEDDR